MDYDFTQFYEQYEQLVTEVDKIFASVSEQLPDCVACEVGCSDCCHAMFDLTFIEAMYLNAKFNEAHANSGRRQEIIDRADRADREGYRIKRKLFKASQEGRPTDEILEEAARLRLRCPLLNDRDKCEMYDYRPITCRLYGIPLAIGGSSHTCHRSNFMPGVSYPTVNMDAIQDRLIQLSQDCVASFRTRHLELPAVLVPVSMALITTYDKDYLGIVEEGDELEIPYETPDPSPPKPEGCDPNQCASFVIGGSEKDSPCSGCSSATPADGGAGGIEDWRKSGD